MKTDSGEAATAGRARAHLRPADPRKNLQSRRADSLPQWGENQGQSRRIVPNRVIFPA